jgi:hypothetical protein
MIDPIHQFNIDKIFTIGHIGNQEIAFTNSSAYMFVSVALISLLMIGGVAGRQLVPGRFQSMAELSYEFVANTIRSSAGSEGMKFFPRASVHVRHANAVDHSLHVHGWEPHHRHGVAGAVGVLHRAVLRFKNGLVFLAVRALRRSDYILPLVVLIGSSRSVAPVSPACVCSPTCWPATSR